MQITIPAGFYVTQEQFDQLAQAEEINKLELTATGELIVVPPTGGDTGNKNSELNRQIGNWAKQDGRGVVFDSSTLFILPNGARRSPDVSWILKTRWNQLTPAEKQKFPPIAPDFVIELLSPSDSLSKTKQKMQEYIANGVRLGWLINPQAKNIEIFRPNQPPEIMLNPQSLGGEDILPNFILDLTEIFVSLET